MSMKETLMSPTTLSGSRTCWSRSKKQLSLGQITILTRLKSKITSVLIQTNEPLQMIAQPTKVMIQTKTAAIFQILYLTPEALTPQLNR